MRAYLLRRSPSNRPLAHRAASLLQRLPSRLRRGNGSAPEPGPGEPPSVRWPLQLGFFADGSAVSQFAAQLGPVFTLRPVIRPITCVVSPEAARTLLADEHECLATPPLSYDALADGGFLRSMRGDRHEFCRRRLRDIFDPALFPGFANVLSAQVEEGAAVLAQASNASGAVDPRRVLQDTLASLWHRLFFGNIGGTASDDTFAVVNETLDAFRAGRLKPDRARAVVNNSVDELSRARSSAAGTDEVSFLQRLAGGDNGTHERLLMQNLIFICNNSLRDVHGLCVWVTWMLTANADWQLALRRAEVSADSGALSLERRVVLETLRLRQSEFLWRRTLEPLSLCGYRIPAGRLIRICIRECHRDPEHFPNPLRFDPDRFERDRFERTPGLAASLLPFGMREHACIGRELSLAVAGAYATAFAATGPWRTAAGGPTCFPDARGHWEPSRRYRVQR